MPGPFDFEEMFRSAEEYDKRLNSELERLRGDPCLKPIDVGDRVIVAAGLLGHGHEWIRKDIETRLLHRTTDPATSKAAARRVVKSMRLGVSLREFLNILSVYGPMTCREASERMPASESDYWNAEFNKRVHSWHVAGHIELTGEVRDGGRVWSAR